MRKIDFCAVWSGLQGIERKHVGQGQRIKNPEYSANGGFASVEWVPSKTDPRLKVPPSWVALKCLMVKTRAARQALEVFHASGAGILIELNQLVDLTLRLSGNRFHFVAQTNINR